MPASSGQEELQRRWFWCWLVCWCCCCCCCCCCYCWILTQSTIDLITWHNITMLWYVREKQLNVRFLFVFFFVSFFLIFFLLAKYTGWLTDWLTVCMYVRLHGVYVTLIFLVFYFLFFFLFLSYSSSLSSSAAYQVFWLINVNLVYLTTTSYVAIAGRQAQAGRHRQPGTVVLFKLKCLLLHCYADLNNISKIHTPFIS